MLTAGFDVKPAILAIFAVTYLGIAMGRVPGLKATYWEGLFTKQCGAERAEQIDWDGPRAGKTQFFSCRYVGFLVVPESGEYEIALASEQAAKLSLDARPVIDHSRAHNMTERSVKVTLTAGPHPLQIEMSNSLGRGGLHLRGTDRRRIPAQFHWVSW